MEWLDRGFIQHAACQQPACASCSQHAPPLPRLLCLFVPSPRLCLLVPLLAFLPAVIDIQLFITAQHGGRHVFRLCPGPNMTAACLTAPAAVLQRWVSGFGFGVSTGWRVGGRNNSQLG